MQSVSAIGASPYKVGLASQQRAASKQSENTAVNFAGETKKKANTSNFILGGIGEACIAILGCCALVPALLGFLAFKKFKG